MNKGFCEIEISRLVRADWNYKENDEVLAQKLANNIKRNGQIENIIVRELDTGYFEVVNGNHRFDVLGQLGFEKVHCYNLGKISLAQAQRIAIETNETKFKNNMQKLEDLLAEIHIEFDAADLSETMPFSQDYIDHLVAEDVDMSEFFEHAPEHDVKHRELICPHCGKNVYEEEE